MREDVAVPALWVALTAVTGLAVKMLLGTGYVFSVLLVVLAALLAWAVRSPPVVPPGE